MNGLIRQFVTDRDGITLLEVILAISLGAVAMAVLFSIFISGQGVFIQTRAETGAHGDARVVLGLLANEIRSTGSDAAEFGIPSGGIVLATADSLHLMSDLNGDRTISVTEPPEDVLYAYDNAQGTLTRDMGTGPVVILDQIDSPRKQTVESILNSCERSRFRSQSRLRRERWKRSKASFPSATAEARDVRWPSDRHVEGKNR
jgi:Tfp pilus assembly protein PilW